MYGGDIVEDFDMKSKIIGKQDKSQPSHQKRGDKKTSIGSPGIEFIPAYESQLYVRLNITILQ